MSAPGTAAARIRIGVSSCLLGMQVRYDGGHKRSDCVAGLLADLFECVPVCPELEAGLGVPRPAMRLAAGAAGPRLVEIASGRDHTQRLEDFARARLQALAAQQLSGYILKKDSPSCGLTRVEVTRSGSAPERDGRGLFAAELLRVFAELPVEEEDRLEDPALRESFIERVIAYHRLRHFR